MGGSGLLIIRGFGGISLSLARLTKHEHFVVFHPLSGGLELKELHACKWSDNEMTLVYRGEDWR